MILLRKKNAKKSIMRLAVTSIFILSAFLLSFVIMPFNSAFAQWDANESNQKAPDSGSQQNYRIIVKLNNETAMKAEAQINEKDMVIPKSSSKNMGDLFSKYKIKKMEPVYKGLVNWKKKTGKSEKEYYKKIRQDFQKRSKRSNKDVSLENTDLSNTYVIEADLSSQEEYEKLLESLKKDARFEYAEADMVLSADMVPNDPYFSSSGTWGQPFDDLYGLKIISSPGAWDTSTGDGITVAVVDTGIDNTHPDISANMWTNKNEIANNGIDDDNNGYIDDTWGWNFIYGNKNPIDDNGHGTHVAGTIAATGNNGIGIVGVAPGAKVMAVKGLNQQGSGDTVSLANGIIYAAENGADVINCSFGGAGYSQALEDAVTEATNLGAVVVVSAGNNSNDANKYSPAGITDAITVAATDNKDKIASFSNWGSCIDVAAPGVDILSLRASGTTLGTVVSDKYVKCDGTSMAAPHVAGMAALILSRHPEFSYDQVGSVIRSSATDIMSTGYDYYSGYGRINTAKALLINSTLTAHIKSPVQGSSAIDLVPVMGSAKGNNFLSYTLEYGKLTTVTQEPSEWNIIEQRNIPVDEGQLGVFDTTALPDGKYVIRLSVKDSSNPQNIYFDRVELKINRAEITSPAFVNPSYAPIMKPGKVIPIQGSISGQSFQRYRMEWGEGLNPTEWFTTGFTLESGGNNPVTNGILANWDSSVYPGRAGYYELRLLVDYTGYTDVIRTLIYLEPDLASANWPQKLENAIPPGTSFLPVQNAAGQNSLVGISSTTINETSLVKYSYDGTLQYNASHNQFIYNQAAVGNIDDNPGEETVYYADGKIRILKEDNSYTEFTLDPKYNYSLDYITLQDLDNDAIPEIMVIGSDYANNTRYLYAFKPDGTLLSNKFPIPIPNMMINTNYLPYYLVMDINNDGEKEIITQQYNDNYKSLLKLYKWDGTQIDWQTAQPSFPNAYITNMAGGDLDHDGQGEIILCTYDKDVFENRKLYIIASDGSYKKGWPRTLPAKHSSLYKFDLAIADMDRDGTDEIIYSHLDEINVLKMDGNPLSDNWGIAGEYIYGNIVIGDINSDNYPEILAIRSIYKKYSSPGYEQQEYWQDELFAMDKNAQIVKQWTILGTGGERSDAQYNEPVLGDFDNNGKVDIAVCTSLIIENSIVDSALYILSTGGDYNPENMDWPVRLNDPQNTSVHIPKNPMPDVAAITLNIPSTSIRVGQTIRLSAAIEPKGANTKVLWSVSDESVTDVAEVTNEGVVFAKHPGTAVIKATSAVDPSKYAECTVTVTEAEDGVLLSEGFENSSISEGWSVKVVDGNFGKWSTVSSETIPIAIEVTPKSGAKMAKFNSGEILSRESTRLYRTRGIDLENGSYSLDFWMYHDNQFANSDFIQVQITTDAGAHWTNVGDAIYRNSGSTGWSKHAISLNDYRNTSDIQIAFLGVSAGGNNIYLDDVLVTDTSSVVPVSNVSLSKTSVTLEIGQTEQLTATVAPDNATNKNVVWTVQGTGNAVAVLQNGIITANNAGTAVIRATSAADASKFAECTVTVKPGMIIPVTGVGLNTTSAILTAGQTRQLTATVAPANATNKEVIWTVESQSTGNVATVSSTGLIMANNAGTAVVRATSAADASKYAECAVTVTITEPDTSPLLDEGFEGSGGSTPAGWAVQDVSGTSGDWTFVTSGTLPDPGGAKAGVYMAKFNSLTAIPGDSTRLYRTLGLALGNDGTYTLDFWMYHDADNVRTDNIQVQISIDGGSTWMNLGDAVNRYSSSPGWEKHTFSLDSFKGASDLRIAFLANSQFGRNMYLDEIYISGTAADTPVTAIDLNTSSSSITAEPQQLNTTVEPADLTNKE